MSSNTAVALEGLRIAINEQRAKEDDWMRTIADLATENLVLSGEILRLGDELNAMKSTAAGDVFGFPDAPLTPAP